jgi:hypothetical protein
MGTRDVPVGEIAVRLTFDFVRSLEEDVIWMIARRQDGFTRIREVYSDWATMPVAIRVESEWLDVMSGLLGSALLRADNRALPLGIGDDDDGDRRELGTIA